MNAFQALYELFKLMVANPRMTVFLTLAVLTGMAMLTLSIRVQ